MINFLNMKYFITVAEVKSFSIAAKRLYISQQTLSEHIAQIEKEIGTKLFERTRPLTITPAGEQFYRRASEILYINMQMERELQDLVNPSQNMFRLGISHAYARFLLPAILEEFYRRYPDISLQIYEMSYEEMDDAMAAGKVDLIFTRPFRLSPNIKAVPLYEDDDVYLYAPRLTLESVYKEKLPEVLKRLKNGAKLTMVQECPFILPRSGNVHQNAARMFQEEKIAPTIRIEVDTLETAIILCQRGLGITISPSTLLATCTGIDFSMINEDAYLISRSRKEYALAICYRENMHVTQAMKAFIQVVQNMNLNSRADI